LTRLQWGYGGIQIAIRPILENGTRIGRESASRGDDKSQRTGNHTENVYNNKSDGARGPFVKD